MRRSCPQVGCNEKQKQKRKKPQMIFPQQPTNTESLPTEKLNRELQEKCWLNKTP